MLQKDIDYRVSNIIYCHYILPLYTHYISTVYHSCFLG